MTTVHRVDGLAFLNDDVVGEYKHSSPIQKTRHLSTWQAEWGAATSSSACWGVQNGAASQSHLSSPKMWARGANTHLGGLRNGDGPIPKACLAK